MAIRILMSSSDGGGKNYTAALESVGAEVTGGYCPVPDLSCGGLLLCGGEDVAPSLYGQENDGSEAPDPARDAAEAELFRAFAAAGKPILGICRGMQMVNILLGGDLVQHIGEDGCRTHRGAVTDGRAVDKVHPIRAEEGSLLHRLYGEAFSVNSYHHQAVGRPGEGLRVTARSADGIPEAMEHDTLPIVCVQYHPERMTAAKRRPDTVDGAPLLAAFLELCK